MLKIVRGADEKFKIDNGDMACLKGVLEKELQIATRNLVGQANSDTFRFYQGVAQAMESVIKILPS
jgi:hypothetical protein